MRSTRSSTLVLSKFCVENAVGRTPYPSWFWRYSASHCRLIAPISSSRCDFRENHRSVTTLGTPRAMRMHVMGSSDITRDGRSTLSRTAQAVTGEGKYSPYVSGNQERPIAAIERLRELIAALDRRTPRPERSSETHIAAEAAALR